LVQLVREVAKNNGFSQVFLIGDQVWHHAPLSSRDDNKNVIDQFYEPLQSLDAVVNLDIYGNFLESVHTNVENDKLDKVAHQWDTFYRIQNDWRDEAWAAGCGYVPSVMPGFNNRVNFVVTDDDDATESHNNNNDDVLPLVISRELHATAAPGSLFAVSLQKARDMVDPTLLGLILVSSFNRFREDTQIEPVVGKTSSAPVVLTQNTSYIGYGSLFLEILRDSSRTTLATTTMTLDSYFENSTQYAFFQDDDTEQDKGRKNDTFDSNCDLWFEPLPCNKDLTLASCLTKWSDFFGAAYSNATHFSQLVTIPCGECVVLDQDQGIADSFDLQLLGGLDIVGMLYIRNVDNVAKNPWDVCLC
jgi:hypothetical protein